MMSFDEQIATRQLSNISSNEAYHVVKSASVPFVWESQPGTPKVRSQENSLPPLTPPPTYYQNATKKTTIKAKKNYNPQKKASFLQTIFPKRSTARKGNCVPDPPAAGPQSFMSYYSSSSSSSSLSSSSLRPTSYSVPSSPVVRSRIKGDEDEDLYDVASSNYVCFGNARSRGCYSSMFKKVLLGDFLWYIFM